MGAAPCFGLLLLCTCDRRLFLYLGPDMSRLARLPILLCFLAFLISIQGSQIESSVTLLDDDTPDATQNDDPAFLVTDDKSDDTHKQIFTQNQIDDIVPVPSSLFYPRTVVRTVQAKRHTVLRL